MKTRRAAKADPKLYPPLPTHPATGTSRRSHGGSPPVLLQGETSRKRGQLKRRRTPSRPAVPPGVARRRGGPSLRFWPLFFCFLHREGMPAPGPGAARFPSCPETAALPSVTPTQFSSSAREPAQGFSSYHPNNRYHPNNKNISIINSAEATARGQLHLLLQLTLGLCGSQPLWGRDRRDGKK